MPRRSSLAALIATAVAAPLASAPPAAAGTVERCQLRGSRTVVANEQGRVFTARDRLRGRTVTGYFGCLYRVNRAYYLGRDYRSRDFTDAVQHVRLAGRYAGYAVLSRFDRPCGFAGEARVTNLRTGRVEHRAPGIPGRAAERITDLELKPNSSVGWIATACLPGAPDRDEVNVIDADGRRTLDSGVDGTATNIAPSSLALSGSRLYWTKGGTATSATLR